MTFRDHLRLTGGILKAVFTTNPRTTTRVSLQDGRVVLCEVPADDARSQNSSMTPRDHLRLTGGILKAVFTTNPRTTTRVSFQDGRVLLREVPAGDARSQNSSTTPSS